MNLIFGQSAMGTIMVFVVPLCIAAILYFIKRNKPDNYLIHFIKYHIEPGYLSSGNEGEFETLRKGRIYE